MSNKYRLKKAKITSDKRIVMVYEKRSKYGSWDEYSFTCSEEARPSFYKVMKDLAVHVIEMCELPNDYLTKITVRGVSFSYGGEKEVMGATISASMKLDKSYQELNINTPHKASDSYSDSAPDEMQILSSDCIDDLLSLQEECVAYIDGDRAQVSLFKDDQSGLKLVSSN